jgi:membrane-associated PAP2 superfamily phosphatase
VSSADRTSYRFWSIVLAVLFAVGAVVFTAWPGLDIAVSRRFFTPGAGFTAASDPIQVMARYAIWSASEVVVVLSALTWLTLAVSGHAGTVSARALAFVTLLYAAGPLLLVNGVLKQFSGRARPADIAEFGGMHRFSPALSLSDQCQGNCSFVSGEAAAAVALSITVVVLVETLAHGRARTLLRLLCWLPSLPVPCASLQAATFCPTLSLQLFSSARLLLPSIAGCFRDPPQHAASRPPPGVDNPSDSPYTARTPQAVSACGAPV